MVALAVHTALFRSTVLGKVFIGGTFGAGILAPEAQRAVAVALALVASAWICRGLSFIFVYPTSTVSGRILDAKVRTMCLVSISLFCRNSVDICDILLF